MRWWGLREVVWVVVAEACWELAVRGCYIEGLVEAGKTSADCSGCGLGDCVE